MERKFVLSWWFWTINSIEHLQIFNDLIQISKINISVWYLIVCFCLLLMIEKSKGLYCQRPALRLILTLSFFTIDILFLLHLPFTSFTLQACCHAFKLTRPYSKCPPWPRRALGKNRYQSFALKRWKVSMATTTSNNAIYKATLPVQR